MRPYTVLFRNNGDAPYTLPNHYIVMAENYQDAEEIFYGNNSESLEILWIVETDDRDVALENYWYNTGA